MLFLVAASVTCIVTFSVADSLRGSFAISSADSLEAGSDPAAGADFADERREVFLVDFDVALLVEAGFVVLDAIGYPVFSGSTVRPL